MGRPGGPMACLRHPKGRHQGTPVATDRPGAMACLRRHSMRRPPQGTPVAMACLHHTAGPLAATLPIRQPLCMARPARMAPPPRGATHRDTLQVLMEHPAEDMDSRRRAMSSSHRRDTGSRRRRDTSSSRRLLMDSRPRMQGMRRCQLRRRHHMTVRSRHPCRRCRRRRRQRTAKSQAETSSWHSSR